MRTFVRAPLAMMQSFPDAPDTYDAEDQRQFRSAVERAVQGAGQVGGVAALARVQVQTYGFTKAAIASADTTAIAYDSAAIEFGPGAYAVDADLTIASPIFGEGGIVSIAAGKTLTVSAPVESSVQVFNPAAAVRASGTLTATSNFANGETITINSYVYVMQTVLTDVDKHVLIGANLAASLTNLVSAINQEPYPNVKSVKYANSTGFNSSVFATCDATHLYVTARTGGAAANAYATTETCANASFAHATLTGGADGGRVQFSGNFTGMVNVRWFGATGDGVTHDDEAINQAILAAQGQDWGTGGEFSGAIVYTPGGRYLIDQTLHINNNAGISLLGDGKTKSNLLPTTSMQTRFMPMVHFEANNNYRGFVKWMRITGYNGGGIQTTGIRIDGNGNQIDILENWIDTHWQAVYMHPHSDSRIVGNTHEFCPILYDLSGADHMIISDNTIYDCGPGGLGAGEWPPIVNVENCGHLIFSNNRIISNGAYSAQTSGVLRFSSCNNCTITDNIENIFCSRGGDSTFNGTTLALVSCSGMKVTGNQWGRSVLATISIDGCTDTLLQGNSYVGSFSTNTIILLSSTQTRLIGEAFGTRELNYATGTLTATSNFANNETVTVGLKTYTFKTTLSNTNGFVQIGGTLALSLANLAAAINLSAGAGTAYAAATTSNGNATASSTSTTLVLTAITAGIGGNSVATTETCANASFGHVTLTGGETLTYDVNASTDMTSLVISGCTMARGIHANNVTGLVITSNNGNAFTHVGPGIRLTDCSRVQHCNNVWAASTSNCVLIDGGDKIASIGNTYGGSSSTYAFAILQTVGLIVPASIKLIGETYIDGGAAFEDLAVFQASGVTISNCSGANGVTVAFSERVFLLESNDFDHSLVSYYSAAPASGSWRAGDFVPDWTLPGHTSYKRGWYYDGGSWVEVGNVRTTHLYGDHLVDALDTDALGFYSVGSAGGIARQTIAAAATDPATTQALANDLRTKIVNLGLVKT